MAARAKRRSLLTMALLGAFALAFVAPNARAEDESSYAVSEEEEGDVYCYEGGDQECPEGGIKVPDNG